MARINVEQKALTDPRFYRLGLEMGASPEYAHAVGLCMMIRVWNECIERGKYTLDGWVLQAIFGRADGPTLITGSDLAVEGRDNSFRIRGTKGRIEYLEVKRRNGKLYGNLGAEHGKKGGRPKKPGVGVSKNPVKGLPENPPPAPAPAPAPAPIQIQENTIPPSADATTDAKLDATSHEAPRQISAHQRFIETFTGMWQANYGDNYPFAGGKDGAAVRAILKVIGDDAEKWAEVLGAYFSDSSDFFKGHSLGKLQSQLTRFIVRTKNPLKIFNDASISEQISANCQAFINAGNNGRNI